MSFLLTESLLDSNLQGITRIKEIITKDKKKSQSSSQYKEKYMDTGEKNRLSIGLQKIIASFPDQNSYFFCLKGGLLVLLLKPTPVIKYSAVT